MCVCRAGATSLYPASQSDGWMKERLDILSAPAFSSPGGPGSGFGLSRFSAKFSAPPSCNTMGSFGGHSLPSVDVSFISKLYFPSILNIVSRYTLQI